MWYVDPKYITRKIQLRNTGDIYPLNSYLHNVRSSSASSLKNPKQTHQLCSRFMASEAGPLFAPLCLVSDSLSGIDALVLLANRQDSAQMTVIL